jgi:hypothetical protein
MLPRLSPAWLHAAVPPRKCVFRVFKDAQHHWCVVSSDGMTGGIFVDQDSAIRFARRESFGVPVLVLSVDFIAADRSAQQEEQR